LARYDGRDGLALGDVVIADYLEFSGYWKCKDDQNLRRKTVFGFESAIVIEDNVGVKRDGGTDLRPPRFLLCRLSELA
jgi:hypothetical protein